MDNSISRLIKSTKWVNLGSIILPESSIRTIPKDKIRKMAIYFSFNDLFKGKNSEKKLFEEVSEYNFLDLLQVLAKINYFLYEEYNILGKFEINFAKDIFSAETKKKIVSQAKDKQKLFTHQQLLTLIKTCLLYASPQKKKLVKDDLLRFGKTIMRAADFLEKDTLNAVEKIEDKTLEKRVLAAHLSRNLVFNSYHSFPDHLVIYWLLYFKYAQKVKKQYYPLADKFNEITGIDIELYFSLLYVIWLHYSQTLKKDILTDPGKFLLSQKLFGAMRDGVKSKVINLFEVVSGSRSFYKEELKKQTRKLGKYYFTFHGIWKKPFYKIQKDTYFPLDMQYIEERATIGLYWTIADYLISSKNDKEKDKFFGYYGRIFESLIVDVFKRAFGGKPKRIFVEGEDYAHGVDVIVYYPGVLFFFEITTSTIPRDVIVGADYKAFEKELAKIFMGGKTRKSKGRIVKLDEAIKAFTSGELKLEGVNKKDIKLIYPTVIFQLAPPQVSGLWDWYFEIMNITKNNSGDELLGQNWRNLQFLDVEELFILEQLVKDGKDLPSIFKDKVEGKYVNDSFKNHLLNRDLWRRSKFLNSKFDELTDMATLRLFGKKLSATRKTKKQ